MIVAPVISALFTNVVRDALGSRDDTIRLWMQLVNGTGTNDDEVDQAYVHQFSIVNNSTPLDLDLNAGGLIGVDGSVFSVLHLVTIFVINMEVANTITVGGTGHTISSMFTGTDPGVKIPPSSHATQKPSFMMLHAQAKNATGAFAVTAGTNDNMRLNTDKASAHAGAIILAGRSA